MKAVKDEASAVSASAFDFEIVTKPEVEPAARGGGAEPLYAALAEKILALEPGVTISVPLTYAAMRTKAKATTNIKKFKAQINAALRKRVAATVAIEKGRQALLVTRLAEEGGE